MKAKSLIILAGFLLIIAVIMTTQSASAKDAYYVYVDELPQWANYAGNVMYESTKAWENANPGLKFYQASSPQEADFAVKWVKEFGGEYIGYAYGRQFIEVGLGDSKCGEKWQPYSANYVSDIMKHEIGHILGLEHSSDPNDIMYPTSLNLEYGLVEQEFTLTKSYAQFFSFCTIKEITSFGYDVSSDDPTYGFDVYVVPSINEFNNWKNGNPFNYYSNSGCFGQSYLSYGGTCNGVTKGSGLLIIMDGIQTQGLTRITVKYQEKPVTTSKQSDLKPYKEDYSASDAARKLKEQLERIGKKQPSDQIYKSKTDEPKPSFDFKEESMKLKSTINSKITSLKAGVYKAQDSLHATNYDNKEAKKELDKAWTSLWWAKKYLKDSEWYQKQGEKLISKSNYKDAYQTYKNSKDNADKINKYLSEITKYMKQAKLKAGN